MKKRIAIFISGQGSNMEVIVKQAQVGILKECCDIALVFANTSSAQGLEAAQKLGAKTAWITSQGKQREQFDREILELLEPLQLNYIVLAGYMRILSPDLIARYRNKIINIHPADTAAFQGMHAYEWAWNNTLENTKITVHFIDEGVDTGGVLAQRTVDLRGASSLEDVEQRGLQVEHAFYSEVLRDLFVDN